MKYYNYLLLSLLLGFNLQVCFSQVSVKFSDSIHDYILKEKNISLAQKLIIENALTKNLSDYSSYGNLINPQTNKMDRSSFMSFKKLFSLDAKVVNDLKEVPEDYLFSIDNYIEIAHSYFPQHGVQFGLSNAIIKEIEYDKVAERYSFVVEISKSLYQYYASNGEIKNETRSLELEFIYTLKLSAMDNIRIRMIRQIKSLVADKYSSHLGLELGVGLGAGSYSYSILGDIFQPTLDHGIDIHLGVNYLSNKISKKNYSNKNLYLSLGAQIFKHNLDIELNDYNVKRVEQIYSQFDVNNIDEMSEILRRGTNINVKEKFEFIGLRTSVGIALRLLRNTTSSALIQLQYIPSIAISNNSSTSINGTYSISFDENTTNGDSFISTESNNPIFLEAYQVSPIEDDLEFNRELNVSLYHGIKISGLLFKNLNNNEDYGIGLGLHYLHPLSNLIDSTENTTDPFIIPNNSDGIIDQFYADSKFGYFGFSILLNFSKFTQP